MTTDYPLLIKLKAGLPKAGVWWHWTALNQEPIFRYFLEKAKPKIALEIGTFQGLTAALLAEYAQEVYTIDVVPYPAQEQIWQFCGCRDKVKNFVCKSTKKKAELIKSIPFDFAYIDGSHLMENIKVDYDFTQHCKHLLFHDYWQNSEDWQDVKEFVDGLKLPIEVKVPFAYYDGRIK
jgi:hypothetical protein